MLARDALDGEHGFDVVHDGIRFALLIEFGRFPVLALVVGIPLRREVILLDEVLGEPHQSQRLSEALDCIDAEGPGLDLFSDLEVALLLRVADIAQGTDRENQVRLPLLEDVLTDSLCRVDDEPRCFRVTALGPGFLPSAFLLAGFFLALFSFLADFTLFTFVPFYCLQILDISEVNIILASFHVHFD